MKFAVTISFVLVLRILSPKGHSTCAMWINVLRKMGFASPLGITDQGVRCIQPRCYNETHSLDGFKGGLVL